MIKGLLKKYSKIVSNHPFIMIFFVMLITFTASVLSQYVETKETDYQGMLPAGIPVIDGMNKLSDAFGGSDSGMIVIEVDPEYANSNEIRDVRDYEALEYIDLLTQTMVYVDDVTSIQSSSAMLREMNDGILPKSKSDIIHFENMNPMLGDYISSDKEMSLIKFYLSSDVEFDPLIEETTKIIENIPIPEGLTVQIAGDAISDPIVQKEIGPDMGRTSAFSLMGILLILLIVFRSVIFTIIPLSVIGVGVTWAMGYMGLLKMGLSSASSGVISMIMGIGIDFGIQTVMRFRSEVEKHNPEKALEITLNGVFMPMATTTMAALIGFRAMSMGQLTFIGEMGDIMSYGVLFCFLAAVTLIPALLIVNEKYLSKLTFVQMLKRVLRKILKI